MKYENYNPFKPLSCQEIYTNLNESYKRIKNNQYFIMNIFHIAPTQKYNLTDNPLAELQVKLQEAEESIRVEGTVPSEEVEKELGIR